jgi:hypothetical protein
MSKLELQDVIYSEFVDPIEILPDSIFFTDMKELREDELMELAQMYMSVFNLNNFEIKQKFNIGNGFWKEPLWNFNKAFKRMRELQKVFSIVAYGNAKDGKDVLLGVCSYELQSLADLQKRWSFSSGQEKFNLPEEFNNLHENTKIVYAKETFKRFVNDTSGNRISNLASRLKYENEKRIIARVGLPIAFVATTRNEKMKRTWIKNGYKVSSFSFYDNTAGWWCIKVVNN